MKYAVLTLILTFVILGSNAQSQREKEEGIRSEINTEFHKNMTECYAGVDAVSDFNEKTEFWNVCELKNGNRIIRIDSHKKDTYYQEIYFEKIGELIYAKETENYMPKNHFTQMSWSCEFYAKNEKLIASISFGHGKTEDEEWSPDVIFEMYKKRLAELKQIKK